MFCVAPTLKHKRWRNHGLGVLRQKGFFKVTEMLVTTMPGECYESKYTQPRSWC